MINNRQGGRRRGRGGGRAPNMSSSAGNRQDNRQRGNAAQLLEKYKGLARDAQMQGDRVQTETYLQYADHYYRVLNESRARYEEQRRQRGEDYGDDESDHEGDGREAAYRDGGDEPEPREDYRPDETPREPYRAEEREERGPREDRGERDDRNGEFRGRRPRTRRPEIEEDQGGERIALDVLPPAIATAPANESDEEPVRAPRARRPRRPRNEDEDIAPAA